MWFRIMRQVVHELTRIVILLYLRPRFRFRMAPGSDRLPPRPYLIISNHGTFFDPWLIGGFSVHPFSYMCNDDAFRASAFVKWYLNVIGAFPKKKGAQDYRAMKETLRRLKDNMPVCIFPEGQTTWDGRTQLIYKGLEKLVRRARVPLVTYQLCGNFLTRPWWARSWRSGRVQISMRVLSVDEIDRLTDDQLFEAMKAGISHDEIHDPRNQGVFSGTALAEGLERFLWLCPDCATEDRLTTSGDLLSCEHCGASWSVNALCCFTRHQGVAGGPEDLTQWSDLQRERVAAKIKDSAQKVLTKSASLGLYTLAADGYSFVKTGDGELSLTADALRFEFSNGMQALEFRLDECGDFVVQKKDIFECRYQSTSLRFQFDHHSPMKWVWYCRYLTGFEENERRGWL